MNLKENLEQTITYLKEELLKVRAGRASIGLLENIPVEAYNTKMSLNQLATLSTPEPRLVLIQPWDKSILKNIESALRVAMNDMNPVVDGEVIRVPFPAPTEERRRTLVKEVGKTVEEAKIRIRRAREDAFRELKEQEERKEISEDQLFRKKEESQKMIEEYNRLAEEMGKKKEGEIMN